VRVVFVINSLGAGGTERSTAVLLPRLRALGVDAVVVCLGHRDEGDEQQVLAQGFDVRVIEARSWPGRVRELRRILRAVAPAVVHTAIFDADIVGRLAAAGTGIPVMSSLVNTPYDPSRLGDPNVVAWKLRVLREVDSRTGRSLVSRFHAVTEGVAVDGAATLRIPTERISVVERGRDPEALGRRDPARRARVREQLALAAGDELILAVGRQEFQKGHVHLVAAFGALARDRPGAVLAIAGRTGNATDAIDRAIAALEDPGRVRMLGHRDDVADLLVAADVFAMPSLYEGTAGAAIEALALEVPVVASDLDGTRGVLMDGANARLVPAARPDALRRALVEVLDDPEAAGVRVARGRELFEDRFTLDRSATRMVELYREVAGLPGRPGHRQALARRVISGEP
jgi:glycosyltransferase involved in cell wall biosynthesis